MSPSQAWEPAYKAPPQLHLCVNETLSEKIPPSTKVLKVAMHASFTPTLHRRQDTGQVGLEQPPSAKKDRVENTLTQFLWVEH